MKSVAQIGDVNPIEYGGGYVFKADNETPRLEYVHGLDETHPKAWDLDLDDLAQTDRATCTLYRVDLGGNGQDFLDWHDWIDWKEISDFTSQELADYSASALDDIGARAQAVQDAAAYHGWINFDQYPLQLTLTELIARWKDC